MYLSRYGDQRSNSENDGLQIQTSHRIYIRDGVRSTERYKDTLITRNHPVISYAVMDGYSSSVDSRDELMNELKESNGGDSTDTRGSILKESIDRDTTHGNHL